MREISSVCCSHVLRLLGVSAFSKTAASVEIVSSAMVKDELEAEVEVRGRGLNLNGCAWQAICQGVDVPQPSQDLLLFLCGYLSTIMHRVTTTTLDGFTSGT